MTAFFWGAWGRRFDVLYNFQLKKFFQKIWFILWDFGHKMHAVKLHILDIKILNWFKNTKTGYMCQNLISRLSQSIIHDFWKNFINWKFRNCKKQLIFPCPPKNDIISLLRKQILKEKTIHKWYFIISALKFIYLCCQDLFTLWSNMNHSQLNLYGIYWLHINKSWYFQIYSMKLSILCWFVYIMNHFWEFFIRFYYLTKELYFLLTLLQWTSHINMV